MVSPRAACALYTGDSYEDMKDREYQPGRNGVTVVYSFNEVYLFALPLDRKPPRSLRSSFRECKIEPATETTAEYIESLGKRIWIISQEVL